MMNTTAPVYVEDWFLAKNFTQNEQYGIRNADSSEIIRETEKAVQVAWYTKYGTIRSWVPKSCCGLAEKSEAAKKIEAEIEAKRITARQRFEAGCERYEKLLAFCKEHKIKGVRSGLRMATLLNKVEAAGLKFEF